LEIETHEKMNSYLVAFALSNVNNAFPCYTRHCWSRNIIALVQNKLKNISIVISLQSVAEQNLKKGRQ
jgi:hypothetical protein